MDDFTNPARRRFLKESLSLMALGAVPDWALALERETGVKTLTILHTNDWHSRIDPFPENDPKYPGQGGAARRAALIRQIRNEQEHVLLLDAGDVFQGTPYFNYYGGEPELRLMSRMGYDACTFGNHDFDNGVEGLVKMLPFAGFPFINCNYRVDDSALSGKVKSSLVVRKNGLRIGITGVGIDLEGLVPDRNRERIRYTDPVSAAEAEARKLKYDHRCHLVICLSHLGLSYSHHKVSDLILAAGSESIDLIIGGHTHTFLEKPLTVMNKKGSPVVINQVGWAGLRLGRLDYLFSSKNNGENYVFSRIELFKKSIVI